MGGESYAEFRDYVEARGAALLRMAYLLAGNRTDAEDLLQTALTKTYLAWDRINEPSALDGYVRRIMVNVHISWWRKRKLDEYPTDELPELAVDDHTSASEVHDALQRALTRLPRRQRAAVVLRYYADLPETAVAEILDVSVGTVKSTVSRGVEKLRRDHQLRADFGAGDLALAE